MSAVTSPLIGISLRPGPSAVENGGAGLLLTVIVVSSGARVAEVIVSWVVWINRGGGGTGGDLDVADCEFGPVARAGAAIMPEP